LKAREEHDEKPFRMATDGAGETAFFRGARRRLPNSSGESEEIVELAKRRRVHMG